MKKHFLALTTAAIISIAMETPAFAVSSVSGGIDRYTTKGSSQIYSTYATASTAFTYNGSVSVSSSYSYINTSTLEVTTVSSSKGGMSSVNIEIAAPTSCRSVRIDSKHSVSALNQKWTATTSAVY